MLSEVTAIIEQFVLGMGIFAPIFACLFILLESILPVLPLFTFIAINFISFGTLVGFLISWVFTCIGCFISFILVRKGFDKWYRTRMHTINMLDKALNYVKNLSLPALTAMLAMPFTPAFMINIAAGLANMKFKKFFIAIIISKIFLVYFWGYIGVSLVESFSSPSVLLKVLVMIATAYIISLLLKRFIKE